MIPLHNDTLESYVQRNKDEHLHWAKVFHDLGRQQSMWLQLLYWVMSDEIYGEHWGETVGRKK